MGVAPSVEIRGRAARCPREWRAGAARGIGRRYRGTEQGMTHSIGGSRPGNRLAWAESAAFRGAHLCAFVVMEESPAQEMD